MSKITAPTLHRVHANDRLFGRLDAAFARRIVWVHGPPGAGKTTLVASHLAARGLAPLWYRLDEGDADPATLFFYLAAAARPASLPLLTPELRGTLPAFTRRFFRDLFAGPRQVLVFDDYHEVAAEAPLHEALPHGLEEVPDDGHVVIISRAPPPPPMARLRLNGLIEIVEPDALRMTEAEARGLACQRGAEATRIGEITRRTQGWAAGVILMLESTAPEATMPQGDAAVPEVLFDYFAGEILRGMEPGRRGLLPKLALLPSMTKAQAVALAGSDEASDLLEDLRRRNYFTTRDGAAEPRFRFHPLFHDFLAATLRDSVPADALNDLRVRAAMLLDADDQPAAAVPLLAEAHAFDAIADIIRARARALLKAGRHATIIEWFGRLPADAIEHDAWLCNWYAESHIYYESQRTWSRLSQARMRFAAAGDIDGQLLAWAGLAELVRADAFGAFSRYDDLIATMRALLAAHPSIVAPGVLPPHIMVRVAMGMALALARRTDAREEIALWQDRARAAAEELSDHVSNQFAYMFAITDMHDANYAKAVLALDTLPDPLTSEHMSISGCVSGLIARAMALVYRIKPGDCEAFVEAALHRCDELGYHGWDHLLAGLVLHDVCRRGDRAASTKWLARMKASAAPFAADRGAHYHTLAAYHHLLHGDLVAATEHAQQSVAIATRAGWPFFEALAGLALAETRIDARDFDTAEDLLDRLDALRAHNAIRVIDTGVVCARADLALARGDVVSAHAILARALALGIRQGDRRLGLSAARLQRLFTFALERRIEPDYVAMLIRDLGLPAPDPFDERWPRPLRITTLGGLGVSRDGAPLAVSRKTPKRLIQLLKAIVAYGGRAVPEEKLIDAVWPDEDGDAARSALSIAIHRLRKLLGDGDVIQVSGGTIGLDPARCWVDVWTIDSLLKSEPTPDWLVAEDAMRRAGRTPCCERVLALYHGDFLPEDMDAPWAAPARTRLRRRFSRMICLRAGMKDAPAMDLLHKGIDAAPEAEDLYQGLMRHHLDAGSGNEGLAVYTRLKDMLRERDGAAPSPASETLHRKLRDLINP